MSTKIEFNYTAHTMPYTYRGVTISSPEAHKFHLVGTPTGTVNFWLYEGSTKPSWLEYDVPFQLVMEKTGNTNKVSFLIQIRSGTTYTNYVLSANDTQFTIPSGNYNYFNITLRMTTSVGAVNETVHPYIYKMETFSPRLNSNGMAGSKYWYNSNWNPYYPENGLPNCTCYAWGRWAEIMDVVPNGLGRHNAETWWSETTGYNKGQTPKLGAIICFADGPYSGLGHVAVVEQIDSDGTVTFSNSAYNGQYFYLRSGKAEDNYGYERAYRLQGFIYLPDEYNPHPPEPIPPIHFEKPLWFYCKRKPF